MIINEFFDNTEQNVEGDDRSRLHIDLSVELDAANIASNGKEEANDVEGEDGKNDEDDNADDCDGNDYDTNVNRSNGYNIIVGMTQGSLKVCFANVNYLSFTYMNEAG